MQLFILYIPFFFFVQFTSLIENGLRQTSPLGWRSMNACGPNIDQYPFLEVTKQWTWFWTKKKHKSKKKKQQNE